MKSHLKVKIKSLAAEAGIIRKEENRCRQGWRRAAERQKMDRYEAYQSEYNSLREHRRGIVRWEARASHLAYAYIRGKAYAKTEPANSDGFDLDKVAKLAARFGGKNTTSDEIKAWREVTPV